MERAPVAGLLTHLESVLAACSICTHSPVMIDGKNDVTPCVGASVCMAANASRGSRLNHNFPVPLTCKSIRPGVMMLPGGSVWSARVARSSTPAIKPSSTLRQPDWAVPSPTASTAGPKMRFAPVLLAPDQRKELVALFLQQHWIVSFDVKAQQRLCVRWPDVAPPVVVLDRDAVKVVNLARAGIALRQLLELGRCVSYAAVDLARAKSPVERPQEFADALAFLRDELEHDEQRNEPRVGVVVIAEVEVPRMLAAKNCVAFAHDFLDNRVTDARAHSVAAC